MIVLRKNDNIIIPDYNDLDNKPKINGVTLEGDLTSEDLGITGVDVDLSNYYTKIQSDNRFQPKGSYATIGQLNTVNNNINDKFDDYYDKGEIDVIIAGIEVSGSGIPYVVISNENNQLTSFGNLTDVINASINKTPYLAYLYNNNALPIGKGMYELQHVEYNETTGIGLFRVHIDKGAAHVNLDFNFEKNANEFVLTTVSQDVIHYAQQNYVDSAMNYITANYATKSAVKTEIENELSDYNSMIVNTYQPKGNYLTSVPTPDWLAGNPNAEGYIKNRTHYLWNERVNTTIDVTSTIAGETLVGGLSDGMIMQIINPQNVYNNGGLYEVHLGNRVVLPVNGPTIEGIFTIVDDAIALVQNNAGYGIQNELKFVVYDEIKKLDDFFISPNIARIWDLTENYYTKTEIDTQIGDVNTILENIIG